MHRVGRLLGPGAGRMCVELLLVGLLLASSLLTRPAAATELPEMRLRIVGGLAGVSQFTRHEMPFWTKRIPERSGGRITADISAFDQSGLNGDEILRLLNLGVVQFGTMLLNFATDDPEMTGPDLPLVSPDFATLRKVSAAYRPFLHRFLRERYGLELLAVYTYPAQVIYCRQPFRSLNDLKGRRIRTSGVAQSELVEALGAVPVLTPFAEIVDAIRQDVVDCAITGTLTGNNVGLHEVTTHIHELAVTWGASVFAVNGATWDAMAPAARAFLGSEIATLEADIWAAAERDTGDGLACNAGQPACVGGRRGRMTRVPLSPDDSTRLRALLRDTVLPAWVERCGNGCTEAWNATVAPILDIPAPKAKP